MSVEGHIILSLFMRGQFSPIVFLNQLLNTFLYQTHLYTSKISILFKEKWQRCKILVEHLFP